MSNATPTPSRGTDAADGSHFTVEDAGSTSSAADLFDNDTTAGSSADRPTDAQAQTAARPHTASATPDVAIAVDRGDAPDSPSSPPAPGAPEAPSAPTGLAALAGDDSIGHVFDQTNGVIDGLDGDSDGTADSDIHSGGERGDENPGFGLHTVTDSENDPNRTGN